MEGLKDLCNALDKELSLLNSVKRSVKTLQERIACEFLEDFKGKYIEITPKVKGEIVDVQVVSPTSVTDFCVIIMTKKGPVTVNAGCLARKPVCVDGSSVTKLMGLYEGVRYLIDLGNSKS